METETIKREKFGAVKYIAKGKQEKKAERLFWAPSEIQGNNASMN